MPLDVPPKKDVQKEGDKPQEHGADTQQSRLLLSLEASKKPEHKPEQKAKPTANDESLAAYVSSGIDKASVLLNDTLALLPTLKIEDKTITKSTAKVDIESFLKENCGPEAKNKACSAKAVDSSIGVFQFKENAPLVENKQVGAQLNIAEMNLSKNDWNKVMEAYRSQVPDKAGQVEHSAAGLVHRDATGKADVVRTTQGTVLRTTDGGQLNASDAGDKVKTNKDGKVEFTLDKDQNFIGLLESGNRVKIDKATGHAYLIDKNNVAYGNAYNAADGFRYIGNFKDGNLEVSNESMTSTDDFGKMVEDLRRKAAKSGVTEAKRAADGIVAAAPDQSFIALKDDGSSITSMPDGGYLLRSKEGQISVCSPDGTVKILSAEFLHSIRESNRPELRELVIAAQKLRQFSMTNKLPGGNTTLTLTPNGADAIIGQDVKIATVNGVTTITDNSTGGKQVVNVKEGFVDDIGANGKPSRIEAKPDGQFKVQTRDYTYDSGTVTTKDGDVFSANHVRLANGTEIDSNNTVTMADGTTIRADGSYSSQSRGKVEMVMASKAAESKAASMAGYAEGMAGAIRSRAASGHATASDIASLESVFAGLCDAVASLGMVGDPSVSFKLYSAKGTVSESISTSLAKLNSSKAA